MSLGLAGVPMDFSDRWGFVDVVVVVLLTVSAPAVLVAPVGTLEVPVGLSLDARLCCLRPCSAEVAGQLVGGLAPGFGFPFLRLVGLETAAV